MTRDGSLTHLALVSSAPTAITGLQQRTAGQIMEISLTTAEERIFDDVKDPKLRLCLDMLRSAIISLWRPETPRIVKDFTDHGLEHCQRIADHATMLIDTCRDGIERPSSLETFLLAAGIYLHDIGMQCDVTTDDGKTIKSIAETLGADFSGIDFIYKSANGYPLDGQSSIRKNHQFLSAAWVKYAYGTNRTVLGPALGSASAYLPPHLVPDVMDVCL
jgi:hypothetical protein